ncbi:MAG: hypothetical protein VZR27_00920 [Acutalibacteraceae bacterium]|nr:ComF family protein [Clostridia bacterium]MEE3449254.1 hypothetical protein [Acutalibacteraceae bacterium]
MYWLKLFTGNFCPVCGKMIDIDLPLCKECKNAPAYSPNKQIIGGEFECVSAFEHYGTFRNIMLDYKYHGHKEYYDNFAMILCELIDKYYADIKFDYFTAVPSYGKEKTHGFEKVISIAKEASRIQRVKYKQLLVQYQLCKKQHLLTSEKRKENVKNIFKLAPEAVVKEKNILVFDDVVTTGATLHECCLILKEGGALNVYSIVVNRAEKNNC